MVLCHVQYADKRWKEVTEEDYEAWKAERDNVQPF